MRDINFEICLNLKQEKYEIKEEAISKAVSEIIQNELKNKRESINVPL